MLSKSFESAPQRAKVQKSRKSYDFIKYYEPAVETKPSSYKRLQDNEGIEAQQHEESTNKEKRKQDKKKNKRKSESIDVSNIDESNVDNITLNSSKVTSTPKSVKSSSSEVKSIIKLKTAAADLLDSSVDDDASAKSSRRKKRNKSVSFMLDDAKPEAKKSKSNTSDQSSNNQDNVGKKNKKNKISKKSSSGKENKLSYTNLNTDLDEDKISQQNTQKTPSEEHTTIAKKTKKSKKRDKLENLEAAGTEAENEDDNKTKKKKKRPAKANSIQDGEEPACKSSRKTEKPDMIAESLENLNLGANAHTLTNLIDQMTVVDKSKKKKKPKGKKDKKDKVKSDKDSKEEDTNDNGEAKEKVKWLKKKWNKGRRDFIHTDRIPTSVIIENLPLSAMFSYKNTLSEHFKSCGPIKQIGIAELYPVENPKPVFNTTILFETEEAASKALEEDNTLLEGNRIRVKRPLPYNQTTVVVRTYAELTEQTLTTMFSSAGRIRKIKLLVKGKKLTSTAFIEFDGADAVERAIKSVEGVLINRKKVHVFKYQDEYGTKQSKQSN